MWEDNGHIADWNGNLTCIVSDEKEFTFHKKSEHCDREFNETGDIYSEWHYLDGKKFKTIQWYNDCTVDIVSPISSIEFYGEHGDKIEGQCYKSLFFSMDGQLVRKCAFDGKDWIDTFY